LSGDGGERCGREGDRPQSRGGDQPIGMTRRIDLRRALSAPASPRQDEPLPDSRRYQRTIGAVGLALLVIFSIHLFADRGAGSAGVGPGGQLHRFVAPLAGSGINRPANTDPRCQASHPNPRALNVCGRRPLVLAFFVEGIGACVREVSTLQRIATDFPGVQFAALAIRGAPARTTALVRSHGWTIPVAYDEDGRVGEIYGVAICPMIELARAGGRVVGRLIGERWLSAPLLRAEVRRKLHRAARIGGG
jgi:hypothetical protein